VTDTVSIRRAIAADIPAIVALLADDDLGAGRESPDDLTPYRRAFAAIDADPSEFLAVATRGEEVIGTLQLSLLPGMSRKGALRAQVEGVRIASSARNIGLGETMMGWAIAQARARGCGIVQLTSDKTRVDAHRFYDRLGFIATHEGYKLTL
jgi:ribosomal protein S18 acetylase RimI-like enzyme